MKRGWRTTPGLCCLPLAALALCPQPGRAQIATDIVPDTAAGRSVGTVAIPSGRTTFIVGGTRVGNNLFHSFGRFTLGSGDVATWFASNGSTIENIVNRVTGGSVSIIDGTIDSSSMPNAAFFFINPAGIIFGPNAVLDVPAGFFGSASSVNFADGVAFLAATPEGSVLSVAEPTSFGILGNEGTLSIQSASQDFAIAPAVAAFAAPQIEIADSVLAAGAFIAVASGATPSTFSFSAPFAGLTGDGTVDISGSTIQALASPSTTGQLFIGGGTVAVERSELTVANLDAGPASQLAVFGDIVEVANSLVRTVAIPGAGDGGPVSIFAGTLELSGSTLQSQTLGAGAGGSISASFDGARILNSSVVSQTQSDGDAGSISLQGTNSVALVGSSVQGETSANGAGGDVSISAPVIAVAGGSLIASTTTAAGAGGVVDLQAAIVDVDDSQVGTAAFPGATGDVGPARIRASQVRLDNQAQFLSTNTGAGSGGVLIVNADSVTLDNASRIETQTFTGTGPAGLVSVTASDISLANGAGIRSSTFGAGNAGAILINADTVTSDGGQIQSEVGPGATGNGDMISIQAGSLTVTNGGEVSASTRGAGNAGSLSIDLDRLVIDGGLFSTSSSDGATGQAGFIAIRASDVSVVNGAKVTATAASDLTGQAGQVLITAERFDIEHSEISASVGAATNDDAGLVSIDASESLHVGEGAIVSTETSGIGKAGVVDLESPSVTVAGGTVRSNALAGSTGMAGVVLVGGGDLTVSDGGLLSSSTFGAGNGGGVFITTDSVHLDDGRLLSTAEAGSSGDAGLINIQAPTISLTNGAELLSSTFGSGQGGSIRLRAQDISVDASSIGARSEQGATGQGGFVDIMTDSLTVTNLGEISTSSLSAAAPGLVNIAASTIALAGEARISSESEGAGATAAGDVRIVADSVALDDFSEISTATLGSGPSGLIFVQAGTLRADGGSRITSSSLGERSGNAGIVTIEARDVSLGTLATPEAGQQAQIASLTEGLGNAGSVRITTTGTLRIGAFGLVSTQTLGRVDTEVTIDANGQIVTTALGGNGGDVRIQAAALDVSGGSFAESINSSTEGPGNAGLIDIRADQVRLDDVASISSSTTSTGNAGTIGIAAGTLTLGLASEIASTTSDKGNAGAITIEGGTVQLRDGAAISSSSSGAGNAGEVVIDAGDIALANAAISTNAAARGNAGSVTVTSAGSLAIGDGGSIASNALAGSTGRSGQVSVSAATTTIGAGGAIETTSANTSAAGQISLDTRSLLVDGAGARISSANLSAAAGAAGSVRLASGAITISNGGTISTNSTAGAAGDITITMPSDAVLRLQGDVLPGTITTSSGPGTGGVITIARPFLILSDGGSILALGQAGGANVRISTDFLIRSADKPNPISVDGILVLDNAIEDVTNGVVAQEISFIDASGVLRSACPAARTSGDISQLSAPAMGPIGETAPGEVYSGASGFGGAGGATCR